jgi:tetratricopeptide (TPR) repeat protein
MATPPRLQRARVNRALGRRPAPPKGYGAAPLGYWTALKSVFNGLKAFVLSAASFGLAFVVLVLFWRAITTPSVKIVEISVPKELADKGYGTAQVAEMLKENMTDVIHDANSEKKSEAVITKFEVQDITIPGLSLSLEGIEDTLRHFISTAPLWELSGEIITKKEGYGIHLLIWDGKVDQKYDDNSVAGKDLQTVMKEAAQAAVGDIDPYLLAASYAVTNMDKAEEMANALASKYPLASADRFWAHILLGYIYSQKHSYNRAYYEDQQALLIDRKMAIAHNNACNDLWDLGRLDEAVDECQRAIRADSHYASAYHLLGMIYQTKGNLKNAVTNYDLATYYDDTLAAAHFNKGVLLAQASNWTAAEDELDKYVSLAPKDASGHLVLGQVLNTEGKLEDSVEEYIICIRADPGDLAAHQGLREVYKNQGFVDDYRRENYIIGKLKPSPAASADPQ